MHKLPSEPRDDRRGASRAELQFEVEYEAFGVTVIGRCENISETGMLLKTSDAIAAGTTVLVRFILPPPLPSTPRNPPVPNSSSLE